MCKEANNIRYCTWWRKLAYTLQPHPLLCLAVAIMLNAEALQGKRALSTPTTQCSAVNASTEHSRLDNNNDTFRLMMS